MTSKASVFTIDISLNEVKPLIWRRVLVPAAIRLSRLHLILQAAMGWTDSHLHCFTVGDGRYGTDPEGELGMLPETRYALAAIAEPGQQLLYEYDFGDGWDHQVTIVSEETAPPGLKLAVCLDGARACPPEDCGGPGGYDELLAVLTDPGHSDYEFYRSWLGGSYDPEAFSLAAVNADLQNIRT